MVTAKQIKKVATKLGWQTKQCDGSHIKFYPPIKDLGYHITIPAHQGRDLHSGMAKRVIREFGLTEECITNSGLFFKCMKDKKFARIVNNMELPEKIGKKSLKGFYKDIQKNKTSNMQGTQRDRMSYARPLF